MKHKYLSIIFASFLWSVTVFADQTELTIQELKALITEESGTLTFPSDDVRKVYGVVISEAANPNMETNPQTAYNAFDISDNNKTGYIQSSDGTAGLRIKTAATNVITNHFILYSTVTIQLKSATLVKESNPERYTLQGVENARVTSTPGTSEDVITKIRFINELTDPDVYTYVQLKDVEVSLPYGTWTNLNYEHLIKTDWNPNGGSSPRVDAVPTSIRDSNGGHMNVLTNGRAIWCRNPLPTGSGTIKGIVTSSKLKRYAADGNIGRYSIRVLSEADIQLTNPVNTTTLVEWNWLTNGLCGNGVITKDPNDNTKVLAQIGTGFLTSTYPSAMSNATMGSHSVCTTVKAPNSALTISLQPDTKKWYDVDNNVGEGFIFNFSTAGITNGENLTLNFSQGGGSATVNTMAIPLDWQVEYSTDGENYSILPNSAYSVRPLLSASLQQLFTCPGLQDHSFTLPEDLFNKTNVWIRLVVASDRCGSTTDVDGGESGKISETTGTTDLRVRLGVVSIKYQTKISTDLHEGNMKDTKVHLSSSGIVKVDCSKAISSFGIYSLNGQCVFLKSYNTNCIEADISKFQNSVYILKVHTEDGIFTSKVVKK